MVIAKKEDVLNGSWEGCWEPKDMHLSFIIIRLLLSSPFLVFSDLNGCPNRSPFQSLQRLPCFSSPLFPGNGELFSYNDPLVFIPKFGHRKSPKSVLYIAGPLDRELKWAMEMGTT